MRKKLWLLLAVLMLLDLSGCASVQKKFIRKKKTPERIPVAIFYEQPVYQKKYSNVYYYKTHYMFWRSWQGDLIEDLKGGNEKRRRRSAEEALSNLTEMNNYLTPGKQKELKPTLDSLSQIVQKIENSQVTPSSESGLRSDAEQIRRVVSNDFYYDKVKNDVLPDVVDLGRPSK